MKDLKYRSRGEIISEIFRLKSWLHFLQINISLRVNLHSVSMTDSWKIPWRTEIEDLYIENNLLKVQQ